MKSRVWICILLLLCQVSWLYGYHFKKPKPKIKTIEVEVGQLKKGKITTYFSLLGWGKYKNRSYLMPKVGGEILKIYKEAGDRVSTGEVLAQIDTRDLELERQSLELQLKKADLTIKKMEANLKLQTAILNNALQQAELNLSIKKNTYLKLKNGARSEEVKEAYQNWERIKAQMLSAEQDYKRLKKLYKKKMISEQNYEKAYYGYLSLKAQTESSRLRYVLLKKGARREDLTLARLQVKVAEENLQLAKQKLLQLDLLHKDIDMQKNMASQLQVKLQNIKNKISDATIRAPFSGTVVERLVSAGELVNSARKLFFLIGGEREVVFTFSEDDLPYLRVGSAVEVEFPYLENRKKFTGKIIKLIPYKDKNLQKLKGLLVLTEKTPYFVDGAFVHLALKRQEKENVFCVPLVSVVKKFDGNYIFTVMKKKNGLYAQKLPVKLGLSNSREVEIISRKLQSGMQYVFEPNNLEGNEKITIFKEKKPKKVVKKTK